MISLSVDPALQRAYVAPGQYIELRTPRGNGFFVLAGELGAPEWELLVRNAGDAADVLATAPIGTELDVTAPLGSGFPLERASGRELVVAVVGSAVAVARPILARRIASDQVQRTRVYLGARSARDLAVVDEIEEWAESGAHIVLCLSRAELEHDGALVPAARRAAGYVQDVIAREVAHLDSSGILFAAGPEPMLAAMRELTALEVVTNV